MRRLLYIADYNELRGAGTGIPGRRTVGHRHIELESRQPRTFNSERKDILKDSFTDLYLYSIF